MSQCDQSMKESYSMGFGEIDNQIDTRKSKSMDGTTTSMCNCYGKFLLEECWRTKLRVYFYYR